MLKIILALTTLITSLSAFAYRPGSKDTANLNECLWTKKALGTEVYCSDLYNHYLPEVSGYKAPSKKVRLGSYNIFRLSEQRKNKNFDWTSEMINSEWDVVALSELQTSNATLQKENGKLAKAFDKGNISLSEFRKQYVVPAYTLLLQELQKKDPSWGLIISGYSQGSDSELLGFLYRANSVEVIESQYCKKNYIDDLPWEKEGFIYRETGPKGFASNNDGSPVNDREYVSPQKALACPLALTGINKEQFTKVPLVARFRSGKFEFNYITLHLSFRAWGEKFGKCKGRCQLNSLRLLSTFSGEDNNEVFEYITEYMKENEDLIASQEKDKPSGCDSTCRAKYNAEQEKIEVAIMEPVYKKIARITEKDSIYRDTVNPALEILNKEKKLKSNPTGRPKISRDEGRELARFFQTKAVLGASTEMSFIEDSADVIVGGDFNLYPPEKDKDWHDILWAEAASLWPDSKVLIDEKTSVSVVKDKSGDYQMNYISAYDHFILSTSESNECDTDSAKPLDFIDEDLVLSNGFKLGDEYQDEEDDQVDSIPPNKISSQFKQRMSDHLPISMSCSVR